MKLAKITLALFVLKFAFLAHADQKCLSFMENPEVAVDQSTKLLKRAWAEYSLTDTTHDVTDSSFQTIWQGYQTIIDRYIAQLQQHRSLSRAQKQWLIYQTTAELTEAIRNHSASLRMRWEYSKTFISDDPDRHREMIKEIEDEILLLTTDASIEENTYNAMTKFTPRLNYV